METKIAFPNRLRDTISLLKLKLAQTEEDVSCPAIYRLRAKLRELMRGGQTADQQVTKVVERSIETLVDLSKSCEDLRLENERLSAELAELRGALADLEKKQLAEEYRAADLREESLKTVETATVPEYIDVSELLQKLQDCELVVSDLKDRLGEKDNVIDALRKELDAMIAEQDLLDQIAAMKEELARKDDKVS